MTRWRISHGEILDLSADGLICSANPSLNLSGGVGGAILQRVGPEMQTFLHGYLRDRGLLYVTAPESVLTPSCGTPYRMVAHAVAIDAFYETKPEWILKAYSVALAQLAGAGCRSVVAACLGCGYGRFPTSEFAGLVSRLTADSYAGINEVTLATTNEELAEAIKTAINESTSRTNMS